MLLSHSRVQIWTRLAEIRKKGPVFERTPFLGLPTLSPFSAVTRTCQLHTLSPSHVLKGSLYCIKPAVHSLYFK